MSKYILALDQGTTSSRAILFDQQANIINTGQKEFQQHYPQSGWVEHNGHEIWESQLEVSKLALDTIDPEDVAAIGITNQRETTIIWDRETGQPIHHAIVWQDRRTANYCDQLKSEGWTEIVRKKTGLVIDAYFSGTKIKWLLDHVAGAREKAAQGRLAFGTVDSWLVWQLTGGKVHITDITNASRTMIFNIHEQRWDDDLLRLMDIPETILPGVKSNSEVYGETDESLGMGKMPIAGMAGDQQAALFGQLCTEPGMVKNTYGTGSFVVMNTGEKTVDSKHNLLTTVAWKINNKVSFALEGSIFVAGAVVQWLRDGLEMIESSSAIEALANSVEDNGGVYLVPAFTGLGAPHWDQYARGTIMGLSRGTKKGHIARAALESIALQAEQVIEAMNEDSGIPIKELRVDGGATANDSLMQFQSDILNIRVIRPNCLETTAMGAAFLAGLAVGFWKNLDDLKASWSVDKKFEPESNSEKNTEILHFWKKAVERSKHWIEK